MFARIVRLSLTAGVLVAALATSAAAQHTKSGSFYFTGSGNAVGALQVKLVVRPNACSAAAIWSVTQGYDGNGGGNPPPTTATQVRDAILFEMTSGAVPLPANYTATSVSLGGNPGIQIVSGANQAYFDVCVDGTKILGDGIAGPYTENGLTVTGDAKSKTGAAPGASPLGLAVVALIMLASSLFMMRRRAEA